MKRFLTVTEVAEMIGAPTRTVRHWCATGALPCVRTEGGSKRSGDYRVSVDALRDRASIIGYAVSREDEMAAY